MSRPLLILLASLVLPAWFPASLRADSPAPLQLLPISQGGLPDSEVTAQIQQRLGQMGEQIRLLSTTRESCSDIVCLQRVAASLGVSSGRLVAGVLADSAQQPVERRGVLWWLDFDHGRFLERRFSCTGCDVGEAMAHHMALLVEQAPQAAPESCPRVIPPESRMAPSEPVRSALAQGVSLVIRTKGNVKVAIPSFQFAMRRSLLQLGVPSVFVEGRSKGGDASFSLQPQLEIELSSAARNADGVEAVSLTLQGSGEPRHLRFYCPKESCRSNLAQHVAMNIGMLFDSANPPVLMANLADCPALKPLPRTASLHVLPTELPNPSAPSGSPLPGNPPPVCALTTKQLGFRIVGVTLLGIGAAGLITGGVLAGQDGDPVDSMTCLFDGGQSACRRSTLRKAAAAFLLGGLGGVGGGVLLGLSTAKDGAAKCSVGK